MSGFELFTHLRSVVVSSARAHLRLRYFGVLAAICATFALGSCGKSTQTVAPDAQIASVKNDGATPNGGQPSAKFAYSTSELALIKQTASTGGWVTVLSCVQKTPNAKAIYCSGSLECGLFTQTLVRSKNNKKDTSTASVAIQVQCLIDGKPAEPGAVTFAARTQTLSATLEGAIAGCLSIVNNADGTQSVVLDQNCVQPEEIDLILSTLNAASYGFVASNVPVGTHTISLQARISSSTSVQTGSATAEGLVGKGTMICEVVRTAK